MSNFDKLRKARTQAEASSLVEEIINEFRREKERQIDALAARVKTLETQVADLQAQTNQKNRRVAPVIPHDVASSHRRA